MVTTSYFVLLYLFALALVPGPASAFRWRVLPNGGAAPLGPAGASLVHLDGHLILFGGVQQATNATLVNGTIVLENVFFGDVHLYNLGTGVWSRPAITGLKPPARSFHRAVADAPSNSMYLYGGTTYTLTTSQFFNDFWRFDFSTLQWFNLTGSGPNYPGTRIDQAMNIRGRSIWLHGGLFTLTGFPNPLLTCANDLWRYDILSGLWTELIASNASDPALPPVRYQARFEYNELNDIFLLYGGDVAPSNALLRADTWALDPNSLRWALLNNASTFPLYTGIAATHGDVFIVMGGKQRLGYEVRCIDTTTDIVGNPVNVHYALDLAVANATYVELLPETNFARNVQAAYTTADGRVYKTGGFNIFCTSADSTTFGTTMRDVIDYDNHVWVADLPGHL